MRRSIILTFGLFLTVGAGVAAVRGQSRAPGSPPPQAPPPREELADELPPGRERNEWLAIKARHPNGEVPRWVVKRNWSSSATCIPQTPNPVIFVRVCPENGAYSPDVAEAYAGQRGDQAGPRVLSDEVLGKPELSAQQAWGRVKQAIRAQGGTIPSNYADMPPTDLWVAEISKRFRLVYPFRVGSRCAIYADALNGEVGGKHQVNFGTPGPNPSDPLAGIREDQWIPTRPDRSR